VSHSETYWQTNVVPQALKVRWIMCGLLAISASHLAAVSEEDAIKRLHLDQSARFVHEFSTSWEEAKHGPGLAFAEEAKVAAQMDCIHRCCHWAFGSPRTPEGFQLRLFTQTVLGCGDPSSALRLAVSSGDMLDESLEQAENGLDDVSEAAVSRNVPPALAEHLRTLPYRMAEALGKPDSPLDFFASVAALEALVQCCSLGYADNSMRTTWLGMVSWLRKVSHHFNRMVWRQSPAALVIFAHWALLVERAEHHCWFLRGAAMKIRNQIRGELPDDNAIQDLVHVPDVGHVGKRFPT
jgi:hypothetical protein